MNLLNFITDPYDRQARLYPALLLISPVVFAGAALLSSVLTGFQTLAATVMGLGGAFLLTQLARDAGKKGEKQLFEEWEGVPSVTILRHRDHRLDPATKSRYHKLLASMVNEAEAPTVEQENADPSTADAIYSAWSNYLRVNTRDTKRFGLLFQENVNYGYRRNVWGLRAIGIVTSLLSLIVCGVQSKFTYQATGKFDEALLGAGTFAAILLVMWLFKFTRDWVRVPADAYAERLVECTEMLGINSQ